MTYTLHYKNWRKEKWRMKKKVQGEEQHRAKRGRGERKNHKKFTCQCPSYL
jgi:hypothetical protein